MQDSVICVGEQLQATLRQQQLLLMHVYYRFKYSLKRRSKQRARVNKSAYCM